MKSYLPHIITLLLYCNVYTDASACDDSVKLSLCTCAESTTNPDILNINCSRLDIRAIPGNLPDQILSVDLSNNFLAPDRIHEVCNYKLHTLSLAGNRISNLPDGEFDDCSEVYALDMSNNDIDQLTKNSFHGLKSLRNLTGVEARNFENNVFANLTSLRHLKITTHQMSVPSNLFHGLQLYSLDFIIHGALELPEHIFDAIAPTLTSLTLSSDSLEWLHLQQLEKLMNLTTFTLSSPSIRQISPKLISLHHTLRSVTITGMRYIPRNFFSSLDHLNFLTLRDLEDMPSELFEGLFSLISLDIGHCRIPEIPNGWFLDLVRLETLCLQSNGISNLTMEDMHYMNDLKVLDISHNNLREIADDVFTEVIDTVEVMDLSHNKIRRVSAGHFKGAVQLEVLNLSHNQLRFIEKGSFKELPKLKELYLESNYLKLIQPDMLENSQFLVTLDLSTNSIIEIPKELLHVTTRLQTLDISENEVSYIGNASVYPTATLSRLDMRYNPIVCDCELYKLRLDIHTAAFLGTCSNGVSIMHFIPDEYCKNIPISSIPASANITTPLHTSTKIQEKAATRTLYFDHSSYNMSNTTTTVGGIDTTQYKVDENSQDVGKTTVPVSDQDGDRVVTSPRADITYTHPNLTVEEVINYHPVTDKSHKIAIGCIVGVSVLSIIIVLLIVFKRRRGRRYNVSQTQLSGTDTTQEFTPLKAVPSIQIEKVDAQDNIKVEIYRP